MEGLPIEVKGVKGQYFQGVIVKINDDKTATVVFEDKAIPTDTISFDNLHLPPTSSETPNFTVGTDIDAFLLYKHADTLTNHSTVSLQPLSAPSTQQPPISNDCLVSNSNAVLASPPVQQVITGAWWPGRILQIKGNVSLVLLDADSRTELVELSQLRMKHKEGHLTPNSLYCCNINVPADIRDFCSDESLHKDFADRCGGRIVLSYDHKAGILTVFSTTANSVKKANLLQDLHIRFLQQKYDLEQKKEVLRKRLECLHGGGVTAGLNCVAIGSGNQHNPNLVEDLLTVKPDFMGLAIGCKGMNLKRAQEVPGIVAVQVMNQSCTFKISGRTHEAVQQVKEMLEFDEESMPVPSDITARIMGQDGEFVQQVVDKSGVIRIRVDRAENADAQFVFIGTVAAIAYAKLMLEYRIEHEQTLDELRQSTGELQQQTRQQRFHQQRAGRHFDPVYPRGNDRMAYRVQHEVIDNNLQAPESDSRVKIDYANEKGFKVSEEHPRGSRMASNQRGGKVAYRDQQQNMVGSNFQTAESNSCVKNDYSDKEGYPVSDERQKQQQRGGNRGYHRGGVNRYNNDVDYNKEDHDTNVMTEEVQRGDRITGGRGYNRGDRARGGNNTVRGNDYRGGRPARGGGNYKDNNTPYPFKSDIVVAKVQPQDVNQVDHKHLKTTATTNIDQSEDTWDSLQPVISVNSNSK